MAKVKASRKKGVLAYRDNPFVNNMEITTTKKRLNVGRLADHMDRSTGEVLDVAEVCHIREVDDAQFIKLYTQNLKAFFDLKPATFKVLQVVLHELQGVIGNDRVCIHYEICQQYCEDHNFKVSKSAFYTAMGELLDKKFLAESTIPSLYFINPNLFFNGDRARFVTEIRRKKVTDKVADRLGSQLDLLE